MVSAMGPSVLQTTVVHIESHLAQSGWDRPSVLFALVDTADLLRREPSLASSGTLAGPVTPGSLTPVEQEPLGTDPLDEVLAAIEWPAGVLGCVLAHEVLVLPPSAEAAAQDRLLAVGATKWATSHPQRREVRMVVGVLRDGSRASALRLRATRGDATATDDVLIGPDLAPNLAEALLATLH